MVILLLVLFVFNSKDKNILIWSFRKYVFWKKFEKKDIYKNVVFLFWVVEFFFFCLFSKLRNDKW